MEKKERTKEEIEEELIEKYGWRRVIRDGKEVLVRTIGGKGGQNKSLPRKK